MVISSTDTFNNIELDKRITCGKIKSKAKTLFVRQINKKCMFNEHKEENLIIPTIEIDEITFNYINLNDYDTIKTYIINSTIIISNSNNPKETNLHVLILPGYLCDIKKTNDHKIKININFKKFFPYNIPININNLYFMIWFKNIISDIIIDKTYVSYKITNIEINKFNMIDNGLSVQQTQTFNIICQNKISNTVIKKTIFDNMCRAFWIKFNIIDYNNLDELKIDLNNFPRIILTKRQINMICEKIIISNNYVLIFLNLEFGSNDWSLSHDLKQISKTYSNAINASRIDSIKWYFKFINNFTYDNIQITSLSLNLLSFGDNLLKWKYF